jgi:hypothetical protein
MKCEQKIIRVTECVGIKIKDECKAHATHYHIAYGYLCFYHAKQLLNKKDLPYQIIEVIEY